MSNYLQKTRGGRGSAIANSVPRGFGSNFGGEGKVLGSGNDGGYGRPPNVVQDLMKLDFNNAGATNRGGSTRGGRFMHTRGISRGDSVTNGGGFEQQRTHHGIESDAIATDKQGQKEFGVGQGASSNLEQLGKASDVVTNNNNVWQKLGKNESNVEPLKTDEQKTQTNSSGVVSMRNNVDKGTLQSADAKKEIAELVLQYMGPAVNDAIKAIDFSGVEKKIDQESADHEDTAAVLAKVIEKMSGLISELKILEQSFRC